MIYTYTYIQNTFGNVTNSWPYTVLCAWFKRIPHWYCCKYNLLLLLF